MRLRVGKTLGLAIGVFLYFVHSSYRLSAQSPVDPGQLFLEAFSSSCPSRGPMTDRALSQTRSLLRILQTIKSDPACQGIQPLLQSAIDLQDQLHYTYGSGRDIRSVDIQRRIDKLNLYISLSGDDFEKSALVYEVSRLKVQLAHRDGDQDNEDRQAKRLAAVSATAYIDSLSRHFPDQLLCFDRHRGLPVQLAGHLLSLSGLMMDPVTNLAMMLSGRLIASFFQFFNNMKLVSKIRDYQKTTLHAGLTCAMEALEQTVCDIQDRWSLLETIERYRHHTEIPLEWQGYELLLRDEPILRSFYNRVEAGSTPRTDAQGQRRGNFMIREAAYFAAMERAQGLISELERDFESYDDQLKAAKIEKIILSITSYLATPVDGLTPFVLDAISSSEKEVSLTLWLRVGEPNPQVVDNDGNPWSLSTILYLIDSDSVAEVIKANDVVRLKSLSRLRRNLEAVQARAQRLLKVERELVMLGDGQGVVAQWLLSDGTRFQPGVVLGRFVAYFYALEARWAQSSQLTDVERRDRLALLKGTRSRFERTIQILSSSTSNKSELSDEQWRVVLDIETSWSPPDSGLSFANKLAAIYEILWLRDRGQTISDRLRTLVTMDLEKSLNEGLLTTESSFEVLVRLSSRDLLETLTPGIDERLTPLKEDLRRAKPYADANLLHFFKHFRPAIRSVLENLEEQAEIFGEASDGASLREMARICVLAMNDPQIASDRKLVALCSGRQLGAADRGGLVTDSAGHPIVTVFDPSIFELEKKKLRRPEQRLCAFRRHQNKVELYADILSDKESR